MYSRKLYATGTATANGVATITVPASSRLMGIQWAIRIDSITDNSALVVELSAASATEIAVNEAQQCLSEVQLFQNFVTSGLSDTAINLLIPIPGVPFSAGQKIYMHVTVAGTLTFTGGGLLWFA